MRLIVDPSHSGLLLDAVGADGVGFTVIAIVTGVLAHPLLTMQVYVPAAASVTLEIEGFCNDEENPFGPVHEYVEPITRLALRLSVLPTHTGELLDNVGAEGGVFTSTLTVPALLVQPFTVTVNEYVPASATVALAILGFCNAELNPFGPVHE